MALTIVFVVFRACGDDSWGGGTAAVACEDKGCKYGWSVRKLDIVGFDMVDVAP